MNKSILKKLPALLAILAMAGGVQTFTSCSSDDEGGDGSSSSGGGSPSSSSLQTQGGGSSSSVAAGSSSSSVPSCGEYDPATQYCSNGTVKEYEFVPYEGQTYKAVVIGEQTWFAENLNYAVEGSRCYEDLDSNCVIYGRLYDWSTVMALPSNCNLDYCTSQIQSPHRGICPSGWHIPSGDEWDKLYRYVDGTSGTESPYDSPTSGRDLKATNGWYVVSWAEGNGTDTYGFAALPGGYNSGGSFVSVGFTGGWWSFADEFADHRYISYSDNKASMDYNDKFNLYSVRCMKD